ncbi:hypothetical protein QTP88_001908 [Uroleucon formosanum]
MSKPHNHGTHGFELAERGFRNKLKNVVTFNPTKPVPQAFNEVRRSVITSGLQGSSQNKVYNSIPTLNSVRSSVYRKKVKLIPKLPNKLRDLIINGEWRCTNDGRDYLLGSDGDDDKIVIFGTESFLRRLCTVEVIFMDGTFKSAPKLFLQIYTLNYCVQGIMVPMAYALLPNKTSATYNRIFNLIKEAAIRIDLIFNPKCFQIDFEIGMIMAIKELFGHQTKIKGCLFHFGQSVWRKVQNVGLYEEYKNNAEVTLTVRRICALALVPIDTIDDIKYDYKYLTKLVNYFVDTYLNYDLCHFHRKMWNHFETEGSRTINHLEGWHAALNRAVNRHRPNIYILINEIKNQQQNFQLDISSQSRGNPKPKLSLKFRKLEEQLKNVKENETLEITKESTWTTAV